MHWPHKDLLCISQLTHAEILHVFRTARRFAEINSRPVKKVPTLKGKTVVLFFVEPSTRTKTSFDIAGKRLSADTYSLTASASSLRKGENLKDSALTLQAMHPDALVLRHHQSGSAEFLAQRLSCSVINAGDGWHAHPTQALLDGFTLSEIWGEDIAGKNILIVGDIAHSRVARSDVELFTALGANVQLCAPRTLLPAGVDAWPVVIESDLNAACRNMDAIICLRLQLERQQAGLLPDLREYARHFGLSAAHLRRANPGVRVMHPGPMNRGVEIDAALADSEQSLILDQVSAGVCTRMALLFLYLTRKEQPVEV
jgi:aspartate carbamoyltransferase catalytic subunit